MVINLKICKKKKVSVVNYLQVRYVYTTKKFEIADKYIFVYKFELPILPTDSQILITDRKICV